MKNLTKRTLTGIGFVSILLTGILFHPIIFYFIFALIVALAQFEFYKLVKKIKVDAHIFSGILLGLTIFTLTFLYAAKIISGIYFAIIIPIIVLISIYELYRKRAKPIENIAFTLFGIIWIVIPFSMFSLLAFNQLKDTDIHNSIFGLSQYFDNNIIFSFFLLLWTNDTFAYLTGISLGKHRLFERISPKKSWEGFFGGMFFSIIVSLILSYFFNFYAIKHAIAIAVIISIFATYGDLAESLFKRYIGVKDSGHILPGHGGILDRFDGAFLSLPMLYMYFLFFV